MARTDDITHFLTDVAAAIKEKLGDDTDIPASDFDTAIRNIESTGVYQVKSITLNTNTTTVITPDEGYDAIEQLTITTNVPSSSLQAKSYVFNVNQNVTLLPDTGYDGFSSVGITINVPSGSKTILPDGTKFQSSTFNEINLNQFNMSGITDMSFMFYNCTNLTKADLTNLNTSNVTNAHAMFTNCQNLANINLSGWNTSNIADMGSVFTSCINLTSINLIGLDTSNVTSVTAMFHNCTNLVNIDLTNFNTGNVRSMANMFRSCGNVVNLDLTSFNTGNVTNMNNCFQNCTSLTNIIGIENLNLSSLTFSSSNMFNNCPNLSNETLDNVLSALSTVTYQIARRSLARQGLTQEQAEICVNLPNWTLCSTNKWTTGY